MNRLLDTAHRIARTNGLLRDQVLKELMHYDILSVLTGCAVASRLVFQGGTAIRLCYGGLRLSEDLDFVCGPEALDSTALDAFAIQLTRRFEQAYDLRLKIERPPRQKNLMRWKVRIYLPDAAQNPSMPQSQFVSVEVMAVPSYDSTWRLIRAQYPDLPAGDARSLYLSVESESEIMADKIVALGARPYLKWRDVWDVAFLYDAGIRVTLTLADWVLRKLSDYGLDKATWQAGLKERVAQLALPERLTPYRAEMSRFLPASHPLIKTEAGVLESFRKVAALLQADLLLGRMELSEAE
ncbi:Putative uncharacterized protein [Candidatus Glomeribacter gigasporarum BEG34]|uniref:Nucleotidyl transferase AbiEii/AbiGii toxin family protein n=1 Tax=Candidatus Glomeribacter gigasporarum BEG34 TaxID=1070319 RepID=G2JA20_9BURK|nr:nucleotidyl transferase AbiEii/AbiGii toxin family protein [Candidatus Glomeribacter gigasporarum]CCD29617.1 Putative uncharacterized protein [Candidatus Glomeribacter gigasporarum BEG34]